MGQDNTSILIVSFWYGDKTGTSSVRSSRLSEAFIGRFNKVFVVTNEVDFQVKNISIYNVQVGSFREKLKEMRKTTKLVSEKSKKSLWFNYTMKLVKSFPTNLLFAEANLKYINRAISIASEIIEKENIKVIFSSMLPYGDHYICYRLKKKYPHLQWIADFRDLHIEPAYKDVFLPRLQRWMERKILAKADIVTTVSEGLAEQLRIYDRPVYAVMRGIEPRDTRESYGKFTIAYTGSLFQDFRDPRPLFGCLEILLKEEIIDSDQFQMIYAGKDGDLFGKWVNDFNLSDIYTSKGLITRDKAQEIQDRSHINLLLTSSSPEITGVLTGKVFEYIESGNATLCLINGVKDPEFEALFQELKAGKVVYHPELESGAMMNFLIEKYDEWIASGKVEKRVNFDKVKAEHSWQSRVDFMLTKLKEQKAL